jgi:hypothetical protein
MMSSDARFGILYYSSFTYHPGAFSLFSEPRIYSIIMYISSYLNELKALARLRGSLS